MRLGSICPLLVSGLSLSLFLCTRWLSRSVAGADSRSVSPLQSSSVVSDSLCWISSPFWIAIGFSCKSVRETGNALPAQVLGDDPSWRDTRHFFQSRWIQSRRILRSVVDYDSTFDDNLNEISVSVFQCIHSTFNVQP